MSSGGAIEGKGPRALGGSAMKNMPCKRALRDKDVLWRELSSSANG